MFTEVKQGETVVAVFLDGKIVSPKDPKYQEWKNGDKPAETPVQAAPKKTKKKKAD